MESIYDYLILLLVLASSLLLLVLVQLLFIITIAMSITVYFYYFDYCCCEKAMESIVSEGFRLPTKAWSSLNRRDPKRIRTNPFFSKMGAVSSVLDAVLRRIGFFASRCLFFRSRRQKFPTCHIIPPSEIDLGLFRADFADLEGKYLFHRIG